MMVASFYEIITAQQNSGRTAVKLPLVMPCNLFKCLFQIKEGGDKHIQTCTFSLNMCVLCNHKTRTHLAQQHSENVCLFSLQSIFQMMEDLKFLIFSFPLMKDFHFLKTLGR